MTTFHRWPGPARIAHRGGGTLAPENTLAAIRTGIAHGYRAVEFDVMLTADDVPVLIHDAVLGRTVAGREAVAALPWSALATRDAGGWWSRDHLGERVPRYDDVVRFCAAHGVWMNVEIKTSPGMADRTGRVVGETTRALVAAGVVAADRLLFSSFERDALSAARAAATDIARGLLVERVLAEDEAAATALGCVSVHVEQGALDEPTIASLHAAGFGVLAWTVNDPARAAVLVGAGIDALVTDRIDLLPFARGLPPSCRIVPHGVG